MNLNIHPHRPALGAVRQRSRRCSGVMIGAIAMAATLVMADTAGASVSCPASPYNCSLDSTALRANGARAVHDATNKDTNWAISANTTLMNGFGSPMATVTSPTVQLNYGQRKKIGTKTVVYAWNTPTNKGQMSGWIDELALSTTDRSTLARTSPTLSAKTPSDASLYATKWLVTGQPATSYSGLKISKKYNATDYLLRPNGTVHLLYNLPGFNIGGFATDTFSASTALDAGSAIFRRYTAVAAVPIRLYDSSNTLTTRVLTFVYGAIYRADGTKVRVGWMAREALQKIS